MAEPTCGVCGQPFDFNDPPPTFSWTFVDGAMRPVLSKPFRLDSETGAMCWCPQPEVPDAAL